MINLWTYPQQKICKTKIDRTDDYYDKCPRLLDTELSEAELLAAGPIILDAWKFSCAKGVLSPSHKESIFSMFLTVGVMGSSINDVIIIAKYAESRGDLVKKQI